jgi:regulator of sigma E protease
MYILLFIAILVILILVHEFGHFIAAKRAGIRVDEFGIGYPPRLFGVKIGETLYSINLLPLGGFVKIYGEDPDEVEPPESETGSFSYQEVEVSVSQPVENAGTEDVITERFEEVSVKSAGTGNPDALRSLPYKPKLVQIAVLLAGIAFNIAFAWILISIGFMTGLPSSSDAAGRTVENVHLTVIDVLANSPAQKAGLAVGDRIISMTAENDVLKDLTSAGVASFIQAHTEGPIAITFEDQGKTKTVNATPVEGIVPGVKAVGISTDLIGILRLPPHVALWEGAKATWNLTKAIALGIGKLVSDAIHGHSDVSQLTGPVGIAGLVGDASRLGFVYLISFTAFISLNLALVNLIPFPALDGGRVLFVIIEAIQGKPINPKFATRVNTIGFVLLLALMAVVTFNDILKLI